MAGTTAMVPFHNEPGRGDRRLIRMERIKDPHSTPDGNVFDTKPLLIMKKIKDIHTPDGREFNVRPLLRVIDDIMHQIASLNIPGIQWRTQEFYIATKQSQLEALKAFPSDTDRLELLVYPINRIASEISCMCSRGSDGHTTTIGLLDTLSRYMWDAKVAIALAAFAVNYGNFWLVAKLYPTNPLAKFGALKQLPDIRERADSLKPKFKALTNLIEATLDVTRCIVEFKELPSQYITPETPDLVTATADMIPTAVYWTIRSIVACASQVKNLNGMGHEYAWTIKADEELSRLARTVSDTHKKLLEQLTLCNQHIDDKKYNEYQKRVRTVSKYGSPSDNLEMLKSLIYPSPSCSDDQLLLWDGHSKRQVSLGVLWRQNVLLFISELDLSQDHDLLNILGLLYPKSQPQSAPCQISQYKIVWLPVVDPSTTWNEEMKNQFKSKQKEMKWYSVFEPWKISDLQIRYIKGDLHFNKKPLLVALSPQGNFVNTNAIHMMFVWGNSASPFDRKREDGLWKDQETWNIELLADSIEPLIFKWIKEGKYICLYGGEDIEWIRKFTTAAKAAAQAARIPLEMLYVGKSNPREKVLGINDIIVAENLSRILPDPTLIWLFWVRVESMWHSKTNQGESVKNDTIEQEIMTMLSFDESGQGWAVISRGSKEMAKAKGDAILRSLTDFNQWKKRAEQEGFVAALSANLHDLHTPRHCHRLRLSGAAGSITGRVVCTQCDRRMDESITYTCCTD